MCYYNTMSQNCKHPPSRYFSGTYWHPEHGDVLWVGCCDCGELLAEKILKKKKDRELEHE